MVDFMRMICTVQPKKLLVRVLNSAIFRCALMVWIAFAFAGASEQRKTTFFCIIRSWFFDNLGIEHNHICSFIINTIIRLRTPIIFASIPTQLSLCAISVSNKSYATCKSSFVATSDFSARKTESLISTLIISSIQRLTIFLFYIFRNTFNLGK